MANNVTILMDKPGFTDGPGFIDRAGCRSFFAGLSLIFGMIVASPALGAELLGARFGPDKDATRIVIDLMGAPDYVISGDDTGEGRIIIEFTGLDIAAGQRALARGQGHIASYQFTDLAGRQSRAVFSLKSSAKIAEAFMLEPKGAVTKHRLVIDLKSASKAEFLDSLPQKYIDLTAIIEQATANDKKPAKAPAIGNRVTPLGKSAANAEIAVPSPSLSPAPLADRKFATRKVIVIDPGHGGADPGSIGQRGTQEKDVTLAAALQLAKELSSRGRYKVVLTRNNDTKIKPDAREALARKVGADLFISLHADAIDQSKVRGGSVYTLSEQGSARSAKQARAQGDYHINDLNVGSYGEEVGGLLFDLAQRETNNASSYLAEAMIKNLSGKIALLNRSHRTADFRVLLAPDAPAVLLEMAFISNAKDEANLNSPKWRKRTMAAVADSFDAYFDARSPERHAGNRAGGRQ